MRTHHLQLCRRARKPLGHRELFTKQQRIRNIRPPVQRCLSYRSMALEHASIYVPGSLHTTYRGLHWFACYAHNPRMQSSCHSSHVVVAPPTVQWQEQPILITYAAFSRKFNKNEKRWREKPTSHLIVAGKHRVEYSVRTTPKFTGHRYCGTFRRLESLESVPRIEFLAQRLARRQRDPIEGDVDVKK